MHYCQIANELDTRPRGLLCKYDKFVYCNCVDTRWQQYSTQLHTNSTQNNTLKQNTQNITRITITIHKHNITHSMERSPS
jgi:hypothetical protein